VHQLTATDIKSICEQYQQGLTTRQLGKSFSVDHTTILSCLAKHNISRREKGPKRMLSLQQEREVIKEYLAGDSIITVGRTFNISHNLVSKTLQRNGIPRRRKYVRYSVQHPKYFDTIDTEPKSYWLGFIAADGCLSPNIGLLTITLSRKDRDHLIRFLSAIATDYPVRDYEYSGPTGPVSTIAVQEPQLIKGLQAQGLTARKTHTLKWPRYLPDQLINHFIRGYTDGDGGFYATPNKYRRQENISYHVTSCEGFILQLQKHLCKACNLNFTKLSYRRRECKSPTLRYCGRLQVKRIFDYLYQDATVWLPRKHDKIEPHF